MLHPPPHKKIFMMAKIYPHFWVLPVVLWGPFQIEILSHLGHPSSFSIVEKATFKVYVRKVCAG